MPSVIETSKLIKKYGNYNAVNNVDLHVAKGDIYGLIGKNGAGKTTLMKLILGLIDSNGGEMSLFEGRDLSESRSRIGSLIEEPGLYPEKTAFGNMKAFSCLYNDVTDEEIHSILDKVGLGNTGRKKAREFSLGMRQRLGIAIALMGRPEILVLDEPINGLDPAGIKEIRDMILKMNEEGITFMVSSHLLDELGKIGTRYGIMANGELVEEIAADELRARCNKHVAVTVDDVDRAVASLKSEIPEIVINESGEENTFLVMSGYADTSEISRILVNNGIRLYSIHMTGITFEEYFIEKLGVN